MAHLTRWGEHYPPLQDVVDYERLAQRADEQRLRVEVVRLEAAKAVVRATNETTVCQHQASERDSMLIDEVLNDGRKALALGQAGLANIQS